MPIKSPDYYMLMDVRQCLLTLQQADQTMAQATQNLKSLQSDLISLNTSNKLIKITQPEYNIHTQKVINDYKEEVIRERKKDAQRRGELQKIEKERIDQSNKTKKGIIWALFFLIEVVLILAIFAAPVINSIYMYTSQKLGYDFYMHHHWEPLVGQWDGTQGNMVFFAGVALVIGIIFLIFGIISYYSDYDYYGFLYFLSACCGIAMIFVLGIAWVNAKGGFYTNTGFWTFTLNVIIFIIAFFAGVVSFFVYFIRLLYVLLICVVVLLIIIAPPALLILLYMGINKIQKSIIRLLPSAPTVRYDDYDSNVDLSDFYNTKKYKDALERDSIEDSEKRHIYNNALKESREQLRAEFTSSIKSQKQIIDKLSKHIAECNNVIKGCPIHDSYKTLANIDGLLYYFNYDLASNVKEAAQQLRNDVRLQKFLDLWNKQHNELVRGQNTIIAGQKTMISQQNAIIQGQKAIQNEIQQGFSDIRNQWVQHEALMQQQQYERLNAIQKLSQEQAIFAAETRKSIDAASNRISNSVWDMQIASHNDANYVAQHLSSINRTIDRK